jgi:carbamate kinase
MIQTAMTEFSRLDSRFTVSPMSVCGAMSQGYMGYDLQNAIRTELLNRGVFKTVATIITQVRVDPFDPAFHQPTKVIGRYMTKEEAELEEKKGNYVIYEESEEGKGYRRIIASPKPINIYEIDAINTLVENDHIVIAAGGGGIPVLEQGADLKGASAIIEKDYTAAKLAEMTDAGTLLFLTSREKLDIPSDDKKRTPLGNVSCSEMDSYIDKGFFDAITTLPKVEASLSFVKGGQDRRVVITDIEHTKEALDGKTGTIIK